MQAELEAFDKAFDNPARPLTAIVGGAKVSTKLDLLGNLLAKVDTLIIGGAMANTFLAAQGKNVGKSLCETRSGSDGARHHGQGEGARPGDRAADRCGRRAEIRGHVPSRVVAVDADRRRPT